jgi:multimeric flavodoxin WrbA
MAGRRPTITSFHSTLLHQGMIIVGVPYSEPRLVAMTEITGGTPYGASTITAADGSRLPTENELAIARFQGRHVAEIAVRLTVADVTARSARRVEQFLPRPTAKAHHPMDRRGF